MYGKETLVQAQQLVNREVQYFGLVNLGANMEGRKMHQQLLSATARCGVIKIELWKHVKNTMCFDIFLA
jgi:hypothetical protein